LGQLPLSKRLYKWWIFRHGSPETRFLETAKKTRTAPTKRLKIIKKWWLIPWVIGTHIVGAAGDLAAPIKEKISLLQISFV